MTINRVVGRNAELSRVVTAEKVNACVRDLRDFLDNKFTKIMPRGRDFLYDSELFKLFYLASAFRNLRNKPGFQSHLEEYNNNPDTTFFVTLIADILVAHGLEITLEPDIEGHPKKPDIYAQKSGLGIFFECKNPLHPNSEKLLREQQRIFNYVSAVITNDYSLACFYRDELSESELIQL